MAALKDMVGLVFGRLTVIRLEGRTPAGQARWLCRCACGRELAAAGGDLRNARYASCGCLRTERIGRVTLSHGATRNRAISAEYTAYHNMLRRIDAPRDKDGPHYRRMGIGVCARWRNGEAGVSGFECFLADMGPRPSRRHSVDRVDNDGNYEPGNCRWATHEQQANNKRNNVVVTVGGRPMTIRDAWRASARVVSISTAVNRVARGWPAEPAISTPKVPMHGKRAKGSRAFAQSG